MAKNGCIIADDHVFTDFDLIRKKDIQHDSQTYRSVFAHLDPYQAVQEVF